MSVEAGFLVVKTYGQLYRDYVKQYQLTCPVYALPRLDRDPNSYDVQYHGIDRDALAPYAQSDIVAEVHMAELERNGYCEDGFIFSETLAQHVLSCGEIGLAYELIWARRAGSCMAQPEDYIIAGYEPTFFDGDHFSASCDCMLIPRWHGTDKEGTLFKNHFEKLNPHGLFATPEAAQSFLDFYLSFEWTETGEYVVAEVFLKGAEQALQSAVHTRAI